jgi:hypothetical protein
MPHFITPYDRHTTRPRRLQALPVQPEAAPPRPDPAIVVGLALKFARLHGRKRAALPFVVAAWLTEHADLGDPACRLVLDWLGGDLVADAGLVSREGER